MQNQSLEITRKRENNQHIIDKAKRAVPAKKKVAKKKNK